MFLFAIFSYPLFILLNQKLAWLIFAAQTCFAVFLACTDGVINSMMASSLHPRIRGLGIGLGFTFATSIFGGFAPVISSWLIYQYNHIELPFIFISLTASAALVLLKILPKDQRIFSE